MEPKKRSWESNNEEGTTVVALHPLSSPCSGFDSACSIHISIFILVGEFLHRDSEMLVFFFINVPVSKNHLLRFFELVQYQCIRHAILVKVKQPKNAKNRGIPRYKGAMFRLWHFVPLEKKEYELYVPPLNI